ncbi:integrase [Sinimarinibacterium flocculans]|uniref:Phage integrase family protein n=1 Tax=Sinimarinibacterium flocculans TaxID=985250 RepID=A0A318E835_9GAMM|nr:site-specific integrase [Sinimarinibacterium flocculans]PXV67873.1 phage integrase family protein [Sinimarinibacterium flocculans]
MAYYKERRWEVEREYADGRKRTLKQVRHDFRITLPDGRRVTRSFKTKDAGQRWVAEQERLVELGADLAGVERAKKSTLGKIIDRYMEEVVPRLRSPGAAKSCATPLRRELGDIPLAALTPERIGQYRDERLRQRCVRSGGRRDLPLVELDRYVKPPTVKKEMAFLARVIDVAIKSWGYRLPFGNPARGVDRPPEGDGRDRRLLPGEEDRLLGACAFNASLKLAIILAIETAARRGELCALIWADIDFERRTLQIRAEDAGAAKTGMKRTAPLSQRAIDALTAAKPKRIKPDEAVLGFKADSLSQAFDRACRRASIDGLRFHDLRHEATSRLFELGLDMMEVSAITGHKTLDMLKRYTQLRAEQIALKMDRLALQSADNASLEVQLAAVLKELRLLRQMQ